jgi:O-antigen ligase
LIRLNQILGLIAAAAIVLSPTLMLSLKGGTGYCYFVVLAMSLVYLAQRPHWQAAAELYRSYRLFVIGLVALPALTLLQIVVFHTATFRALDPLLRLGLAVPSFYLLASLPSHQLRRVQWGFVLGALLSGAWACYATFVPSAWPQPGRLGNDFVNPIPFGDTALLLGFLSVISIERKTTLRRPDILKISIKIIALLGGCYASYLSGSRGGWIAVVMLTWAAVSQRHFFTGKRARVVLVAILLVVAGALASTHVIRERFADVGTDFQKFDHGDSITSTGLRLDLWRASWMLYKAHPLLGIGRGELEPALAALAAQGKAQQAIVNPHAHNEFFSVLAEMGTAGVLALLLLYAGLLKPFWQHRRHADPDIASAAYLGLALTGSTILFGLTIDVLPLVMNAAFLALTAVTLLAWIVARKRELRECPRSPENGTSAR